MLAVEWGVGQVLLTIFWLAVFLIWIMLLVSVFADIFRSHDMRGGVKALWAIFVIIFPYLGVFVYLIARGDEMTHNAIAAAHQNQAAANTYIRKVADSSAADELAKIAALKERGAISDAEFQQMKAKIVGS
jgi:Short C-terminal domain/Phospholipase_D-nuclease N-terminal